MKKGKWFGIDASNEESLFDIGFLMRRSGVMYEVLTYLGDDYLYGLFDDKELIKDLNDNINKGDVDGFPSWKKLAEICGVSVEDYRKDVLDNTDRDAVAKNLLLDMFNTYSVSDAVSFDAFGKTYTESQIRQRLNKAIV